MLANYINDLYAAHCIRNKYDYRTHDLAGRFQTFWIYAAKWVELESNIQFDQTYPFEPLTTKVASVLALVIKRACKHTHSQALPS